MIRFTVLRAAVPALLVVYLLAARAANAAITWVIKTNDSTEFRAEGSGALASGQDWQDLIIQPADWFARVRISEIDVNNTPDHWQVGVDMQHLVAPFSHTSDNPMGTAWSTLLNSTGFNSFQLADSKTVPHPIHADTFNFSWVRSSATINSLVLTGAHVPEPAGTGMALCTVLAAVAPFARTWRRPTQSKTLGFEALTADINAAI